MSCSPRSLCASILFMGRLFCSMVIAVSGMLGGLTVHASKPERPNLILLFADDQRPDTVGAFGNPHIHTPHLDRLVDQGMRFNRNYCAGSYSGAVCVASRTMLMTGRHWMRVADRKDWKGLPLLPEVLAKEGYRTFITGKWHNGQRSLRRAFQSGKNVFMGGMSDHTKVPLVDLKRSGELVDPRTPRGFSSQLFADAAVEFLKAQTESDQPFFLYVAFTAPHDPRNPPPSYRERYYRDRPPMPPNFLPAHPFDNGFVRGVGRDESLAPWPRPEEMIHDQLCEYYGLITHLDDQVGRILHAMQQLPKVKKTYLIYTADHGLAMGSHGLLGKQNIYEHSVRSPFIAVGPGIQAGTRTEALTYIHDIYATFCELAGVDLPAGVDSRSLVPLWNGKTERVRQTAFLPFRDVMRGITDGRWKLHRYPHVNHTLLFDLHEDPHEMNDLANVPGLKVVKERLMRSLEDWQERLGDGLSLTTDQPKPLEMDFLGFEQRLDRWQPKWIRDKYFGGRSE